MPQSDPCLWVERRPARVRDFCNAGQWLGGRGYQRTYFSQKQRLQGVGVVDGRLEREREWRRRHTLVASAAEHVEERVLQRLLRRDAPLGAEGQHFVQQVQGLTTSDANTTIRARGRNYIAA